MVKHSPKRKPIPKAPPRNKAAADAKASPKTSTPANKTPRQPSPQVTKPAQLTQRGLLAALNWLHPALLVRRLALNTLGGRTLAGMWLMAFSGFCATCMTAIVKLLQPTGIHPFEVVFFRNVMGLALMLAWHTPQGGLAVWRTKHLKFHGLRGVLNLMAMLLYFHAASFIPLAEVAALAFTAPLFSALLAVVILKEPLYRHRVLAVVLGFGGALLVCRPGTGILGVYAIQVLISAALWSVALMVIKYLSTYDSSATMTLYMTAIMSPISIFAAIPVWTTPHLEQLWLMFLMALLGTGAQISLATAFKLADASAVLPVQFLRLIWSALLGWGLFGDVPHITVWLGGGLIFYSGVRLALIERKLNQFVPLHGGQKKKDGAKDG